MAMMPGREQLENLARNYARSNEYIRVIVDPMTDAWFVVMHVRGAGGGWSRLRPEDLSDAAIQRAVEAAREHTGNP